MTAGPARPGDGSALVLLSGGQDSATCLAWALERFEHVETLGFDYGQTHRVELECRAALRAGMASSRLGPDHTLHVPTLAEIGGSSLTGAPHRPAASGGKPRDDGLPDSFVPGRNLVFLTFAAALAARRGIRHLVGGMCETDYSGYPDCRDDTLKSLQATINLGMNTRIVLHTPLMWRDKAATWRLAEALGGAALVELIRAESHSCYQGDRTPRAWGAGCAACPACDLRARGWAAYAAGHER